MRPDEQIFIAMAYVEGQSLEKKTEAGPFEIAEALEVAMQVAQGLGAAHEGGCRSPRHQERQLDAHAPKPGQDHGLRPGPARQPYPADADGNQPGDARLHVPGASSASNPPTTVRTSGRWEQ